nr:hypothetical protein [Bacteroidales bacterium]
MRKLSILTTALVAAVLSFASCNKQEAGASSFSLPTDGETLMFTAGQTRTLTYSGENIEACTAKPPKGWIGKVDGNVIRLTAPEISVSDYESGGQVAVYARGTDKTEYVVYFPVQSEGKLDKTNWSIRYNSSEEPADYSSQNFIREDDPSSSMTGWAKDMLDKKENWTRYAFLFVLVTLASGAQPAELERILTTSIPAPHFKDINRRQPVI